MAREIERALRRLRIARDGRSQRSRPAAPATKANAFDPALVDVRLQNLERQLDELKTRVNGLLFLLAGAVATQVVLRLFA